MTVTESHPARWKIAIGAALLLALLGLVVAAAHAAEPARSPLDRKVRVMERVVDEVLVQSPNVTVGLGSTTRGLVLDEFGALFVFDGSLGAGFANLGLLAAPGTPFTGPFLPRVFKRQLLDTDEAEDVEEDAEDEEESKVDPEGWRRQSQAERREHLGALKRELVDALVDYGATLAELRDEQWVAVAAFLDGSGFLASDDGTRLVVKVRMRDLRQHASGALSRDAVKARVVVEER